MRAREPLRKHTDVMLLGKFAEIGCCESSERQISAVGDAMVATSPASRRLPLQVGNAGYLSIHIGYKPTSTVASVLRGHVVWIPCSYLIAPDALWP